MIPFRLTPRPGIPIFEQVVFAAKRAMVGGDLTPGSAFPSVRSLSRELKINPNTAQKVIAQLTSEGLLEVRPGIGTVVSAPPNGDAAARGALLGPEMEQLVVEAKKLGLKREDLQTALDDHWRRLESAGGRK